MKWFKHISDSLDDPFIQDLIDEFGSDGYLVFFGVLEILSREFTDKSPGKVEVSHRYCTRKLRLSWHKISTILLFCQEEGRFFVNDNGRKISINCPKFKGMCDNWTKRKLCSGSVVTPEKHTHEVEVEVEVDKEDIPKSPEEPYYLTRKKRKLKNKRLETFEQFWNIFNFKKSKACAADSWYDIPELTDSLTSKIFMAAADEALNRDKLIKNGQTPKWAQGWLTERRWEDEQYQEPQKKRVPTTL